MGDRRTMYAKEEEKEEGESVIEGGTGRRQING